MSACIAFTGCGVSQGEFLYFLGAGRGQKIEAKFHLTDGPVVILMDDAADSVDWPPAKRYFIDELTQELLKHKAAMKIVPRQTVERLRQSLPKFEERGCREIGELVGAEQVLWIEVRDFLAEQEIHETINAAYWEATVKVINVLEKKNRSRVRLWPTSPQGYIVLATMPGDAVVREKNKDSISKKLASILASDVAKLFYDYRLDDRGMSE